MLQALSLLDNKSQTFGKPLYYLTLKEAEESLIRFFNEKINGNIKPADYDLFHLGEYDQNTGKHISKEAPHHLLNLSTLIKPKEEKPTIINKNTIKEKETK